MIAGLVHLVIYLIIVGLILWLLLYLINTLPIPEQFKVVGRVVITVIGVLICILLLLQVLGGVDLPRLRV